MHQPDTHPLMLVLLQQFWQWLHVEHYTVRFFKICLKFYE